MKSKYIAQFSLVYLYRVQCFPSHYSSSTLFITHMSNECRQLGAVWFLTSTLVYEWNTNWFHVMTRHDCFISSERIVSRQKPIVHHNIKFKNLPFLVYKQWWSHHNNEFMCACVSMQGGYHSRRHRCASWIIKFFVTREESTRIKQRVNKYVDSRQTQNLFVSIILMLYILLGQGQRYLYLESSLKLHLPLNHLNDSKIENMAVLQH